MSSPHPPFNRSAIGWALLSQSIWLPLVGIEAHDRWIAHVRENTPATTARDLSKNETAQASSPPISSLMDGSGSTGYVLGSARASNDPLLNDPLTRSIEQKAPGPLASLPSPRPISPSLFHGSADQPPPTLTPSLSSSRSGGPAEETLMQRSFSRAELLGGAITLSEPETVTMPFLARAERARWTNSGDPLAPLPQVWRAPMRQAIEQLPTTPSSTKAPAVRIQAARVVHVPSRRVSRPTEVPLALQSDGSVDILSDPQDPAVVEEISNWSSRQQAPAPGSVAPAVVHIHPLPDAPATPVASTREPAPALAVDAQSQAQSQDPQPAPPPPPPSLERVTPSEILP